MTWSRRWWTRCGLARTVTDRKVLNQVMHGKKQMVEARKQRLIALAAANGHGLVTPGVDGRKRRSDGDEAQAKKRRTLEPKKR